MDSCGSVCLGIVGSELQRSANNVKGHGNKNIVIIMQRLLAEQSPGRAELSLRLCEKALHWPQGKRNTTSCIFACDCDWDCN